MKLPEVSIELDQDGERPLVTWHGDGKRRSDEYPRSWQDRLLCGLQDWLDGTAEGEALSEDLVEMLEEEEAALAR